MIEGSFLGEGLLPLHPIAHTLWKVASSAQRHFCSEFVTHGTELSAGTLSIPVTRVSMVGGLSTNLQRPDAFDKLMTEATSMMLSTCSVSIAMCSKKIFSKA